MICSRHRQDAQLMVRTLHTADIIVGNPVLLSSNERRGAPSRHPVPPPSPARTLPRGQRDVVVEAWPPAVFTSFHARQPSWCCGSPEEFGGLLLGAYRSRPALEPMTCALDGVSSRAFWAGFHQHQSGHQMRVACRHRHGSYPSERMAYQVDRPPWREVLDHHYRIPHMVSARHARGLP